MSVNTAYGVERVVRDAFARAPGPPARRKLTLVHKNNVLVHAGSPVERTVDAVAAEFPEVTIDYLHVDAATIFLVTDPGRFDVVVTDNLFGDILTDLAAAVTGGHRARRERQHQRTRRTAPSMFEPVHGSAPGHRRSGKADPTAAILSAGCCSTTSVTEAAAPSRTAVTPYRAHGRPRAPPAGRHAIAKRAAGCRHDDPHRRSHAR